MRHLTLKSRQHQALEQDFKTWLETLSYNPYTVRYSPLRVREFMHWIEGEQTKLQHINEQTITKYFSYLSRRSNQRRSGALSNDYLNMHLTSLKQFSGYLQQSREQGFIIQLNYYPSATRQTILTREQIEALYEATGTDTAINLRDRAILALYYGCGLRRNEGIQINIEDLLINRKLLYVRKGKGHRERYIPLARHVQEDLENYLETGRPAFRSHDKNPAFLLSQKGRISGGCVLTRIKQLGKKADITTDFGLHTLRHSIATHLLLAGMKLEQVAKFLGHESLESTQKYTHIAASYDHQH
jgi:integrase/recombinase XerD